MLPHLEQGDLLIDGGNSFFQDTIRRNKALAEKGILYIGTGVSGGEEGARFGPAIMPGGQPEAYALVEPIFTKISAQVDGEPCCTYIGPDGAGHYVKMVHNGIEYGDMQLISEAYFLMKEGAGPDGAGAARGVRGVEPTATSTPTSSRSPATSSPAWTRTRASRWWS